MAQPITPFDPDQLVRIIAAHADRPGPLLPILQDAQAAFGCVPPEAVPIIAGALNLTRAEVHGVVSFYADFRGEPARGPVLRLCRAEACQARGGEALAARAQARLRALGETVTLEAVYCLGLCASGPAAMVDDRPIARLDAARLDALIDSLVP
jgi:formate dehydrogenase subunit gamma